MNENRERWRVSKEVSLADLFSFAAAAIAVVFSWSVLDKRITLLESYQIIQIKTDQRQDSEVQSLKQDIREDLNKINSKLDRLIERK